MTFNGDGLKPHEIWMLRVGFSFALEALYQELKDPPPGADWLLDIVVVLRMSQHRLGLSKLMPPCVRDRFAFFTQTIRLSREQTDQFRDAIFESDERKQP